MSETGYQRDIGACEKRAAFARETVDTAAARALAFFRDGDALTIDVKGRQDWVSNADRDVETMIRENIGERFPEDGIVGEEHGIVESRSGFTWIIDPIDGTTSFVNGIPGWCVVLACVDAAGTVIGVIRDPVADETWEALAGGGARLNGRPASVSTADSVAGGSIAVGHNLRVPPAQTLALLTALLNEGGMFFRCGSGALMLCYVASGRLIGYCEPHMNAWDCMAALLIIEEAGGHVRPFDPRTMIERGGRVVAAGPALYPHLLAMTEAAFGNP